MERLRSFTIPFVGLKNGKHVFTYEIGKAFFEKFEVSPVEDGDVFIHLTFDKRDDFFILDFFVDGSVLAECDRCLDKFELPVNGNYHIYIKFKDEMVSAEDEAADVKFISPEATSINVAQLIYEYILLSMPMQKTCDMDMMQNKSCNQTVLKILKNKIKEDPEKDRTDPRWDLLKDLTNN